MRCNLDCFDAGDSQADLLGHSQNLREKKQQKLAIDEPEKPCKVFMEQ